MKSLPKVAILVFALVGIVIIAIRILHVSDPKEMQSRKLTFLSADGQTRQVEFNIPIGYGMNNSPIKEHFELAVLYPSRAFAEKPRNGPVQLNLVTVIVYPKGGRTTGDDIKAEIDAGSLERGRYLSKVVDAQTDRYSIQRIVPEAQPDDHSVVVFDKDRSHWIQIKSSGRLLIGEGVSEDKAYRVYYRYRHEVESNPIVMHQWAMTFISDLRGISSK